MEIIDLKTWKRTEHYNFFKRADYPQFSICKNVDITNFKKKLKKRNIPFYYGMIYAATYSINQLEEFKYRINGENVILHQEIHPSFTDMSIGSDLFKMVTVEFMEDIEEFAKSSKSKADKQTDYFIMSDYEGIDNLVYITCTPTISFTNLNHTITLNKDDAVPKLAWGKYFVENGKVLMPFSVQAHHSFVDGVHVGKYYDVLQEFMDKF